MNKGLYNSDCAFDLVACQKSILWEFLSRMLAKPTMQLGGIIPKLWLPTGGTINAFAWKLVIQTVPMQPLLNSDHHSLLPNIFLHLTNNNKKLIVTFLDHP